MNAKQDNPQPADPRRGGRRQPAWPESVERRIGLDLNGGVMRMLDSTDSASEESIDRSLPAGVMLPNEDRCQDNARQLRRQLMLGRGRLRRSTHARRRRDRSPRRPVRPI
jgi:hypothetical protein